MKHKLGRDSLEGVHVAVQGVGHVGYHLCKELARAGAKLSVADVDPLKAERAQREFGATVVPLDEIFEIECDVLAPCALGSALNDPTDPAICAARSSPAPRTTSSPSRATATTSRARHPLRARLRDQRRRPRSTWRKR